MLAGCVSLPAQDPWFGKDKFKHFGVSAVLAGASTAAGESQDLSNRETCEMAFGITLAVGFGKEAYDASRKDNFWSWKDIVWDVLGGLAGYGAVKTFD